MKLNYKILLPDPELRAFIYQQAQDLESLANNLGDLTFLIEEATRKNKKPHYRVTLQFSPEDMEITTQGENDSVFNALIQAKEEARMHVEAILNVSEFGTGTGTAPGDHNHLVH